MPHERAACRCGQPDLGSGIAERRTYNAAQRRKDLADAGIELLGNQGARGLSHPRVDGHAGFPAGTTSYYFRTRKALLRAIADRITELDEADLSMMAELAQDESAEYSGTLGLSRLVMLSGTEPYLTRTRARFEIVLNAKHDPDLDVAMQTYGMRFYGLAREVIGQWYDDPSVPESVIDERSIIVLTFISGVLTGFVNGYRVIADAQHLDRLIQQMLHSSYPPAWSGRKVPGTDCARPACPAVSATEQPAGPS